MSDLKKINRHAGLTLLCMLAVILWGAWVRVTGSGAGCGAHWPLCNGEVLPENPITKTVIEFVHRLTSGLALILGATLYVRTRRSLALGNPVRRAAGYSFLFLIFEALIGAVIVLLGWVALNPSVSRVISMMLHLMNTVALIAWLSLTWAWSRNWGIASWSQASRFQRLSAQGIAAFLWITGITGAIAALGNTLFPASSLTEGLAQDFDPASHFLLRLRILHPILAVSTAALIWTWIAKIRPSLKQDRSKSWATGLGVLVGAQLSLGFFNLALLAPGWIQILHLALASLVWICFVLLVHFWIVDSTSANLSLV